MDRALCCPVCNGLDEDGEPGDVLVVVPTTYRFSGRTEFGENDDGGIEATGLADNWTAYCDIGGCGYRSTVGEFSVAAMRRTGR